MLPASQAKADHSRAVAVLEAELRRRDKQEGAATKNDAVLAFPPDAKAAARKGTSAPVPPANAEELRELREALEQVSLLIGQRARPTSRHAQRWDSEAQRGDRLETLPLRRRRPSGGCTRSSRGCDFAGSNACRAASPTPAPFHFPLCGPECMPRSQPNPRSVARPHCSIPSLIVPPSAPSPARGPACPACPGRGRPRR